MKPAESHPARPQRSAVSNGDAPNAAAKAAPRAWAMAFVVLAAAASFALLVGEPVSWRRVFTAPSSLDHAIVVHVRLPRVVLGAIAGAGLAATGTVYQALLRNPLAEPFVLGVAGGASLFATLSIALLSIVGASLPMLLGAGLTAISAGIGGLLATLLVYAIARRSLRPSTVTILLAGVMVNAVAGSAITFVKTLVRADTAQQLLFWLAGFLEVPTPTTLGLVFVLVGAGISMLLYLAGPLTLLSVGHEQAEFLGVDVRVLERQVFFASSLIVGAIVASCGVIGFVGLLVPHLARKLWGADVRKTLPASVLLGAAVLVFCDALARMCFSVVGTEPPVGAMTALLGGPLFLWVLARRPA